MKTKAAILVEQKKPLVIDEVEIPALGYGQVLVEIKVSRICGSQIGEIDGVKGPDKFLPHLLGHEGGGVVVETGAEVSRVRAGRSCGAALARGAGHPGAAAEVRLAREGGARGVYHDFQ